MLPSYHSIHYVPKYHYKVLISYIGSYHQKIPIVEYLMIYLVFLLDIQLRSYQQKVLMLFTIHNSRIPNNLPSISVRHLVTQYTNELTWEVMLHNNSCSEKIPYEKVHTTYLPSIHYVRNYHYKVPISSQVGSYHQKVPIVE